MSDRWWICHGATTIDIITADSAADALATFREEPDPDCDRAQWRQWRRYHAKDLRAERIEREARIPAEPRHAPGGDSAGYLDEE